MKLYEQWIDQILNILEALAQGNPCGLALLEPRDFTFRTFMRFGFEGKMTIEKLCIKVTPGTPWVRGVYEHLSLLPEDRHRAAGAALRDLVDGQETLAEPGTARDLLRSIAAPPFAFVAGAYFAAYLGLKPQEPIAEQIMGVDRSAPFLKVDPENELFRISHQSYKDFDFVKNGCSGFYESLFKGAFPEFKDYRAHSFYFFPLIAHGMFLGNFFIFAKTTPSIDQIKEVADWAADELSHFQYPRFRDIVASRDFSALSIPEQFVEALHRVQPGIAAACLVDVETEAVTKLWLRKGTPSANLTASAFSLDPVRKLKGLKSGLSYEEIILSSDFRWESEFLTEYENRGFPLRFGVRFRLQGTVLEAYYAGEPVPDRKSIFSVLLHARTMLDILKAQGLSAWTGAEYLFGATTFTYQLQFGSGDKDRLSKLVANTLATYFPHPLRWNLVESGPDMVLAEETVDFSDEPAVYSAVRKQVEERVQKVAMKRGPLSTVVVSNAKRVRDLINSKREYCVARKHVPQPFDHSVAAPLIFYFDSETLPLKWLLGSARAKDIFRGHKWLVREHWKCFDSKTKPDLAGSGMSPSKVREDFDVRFSGLFNFLIFVVFGKATSRLNLQTLMTEYVGSEPKSLRENNVNMLRDVLDGLGAINLVIGDDQEAAKKAWPSLVSINPSIKRYIWLDGTDPIPFEDWKAQQPTK